MSWQPIETAPHDAIIWLGTKGAMRVGYWQDGVGHENHGTEGGGWIDFYIAECGRGGGRGLRFAPTCWQPVPAPPAEFGNIGADGVQS